MGIFKEKPAQEEPMQEQKKIDESQKHEEGKKSFNAAHEMDRKMDAFFRDLNEYRETAEPILLVITVSNLEANFKAFMAAAIVKLDAEIKRLEEKRNQEKKD